VEASLHPKQVGRGAQMRSEGSGLGVPPKIEEQHGRDAHATQENHGRDARATDACAAIQKRQGAYLPHWTRDGETYAVTFRLGDSLPASVLEGWLFERNDIVKTARQLDRPLSEDEENRLQHLHSERVEAYLDAGHGACWMRQPGIAQIVADALRFFDGQRYRLHAWCVMPNHVHVILTPTAGHTLTSVLHSWKSFTAKAANCQLGRTGAFWQEEYYDHLIRNADDYAHALRYLAENPTKAGLTDWPWVWVPRGTGVPPVMEENHGRDAQATFGDH